MAIIRTLKPYCNKNIVQERETTKPVFFDGREVVEIDATETTADKNFMGIRFKGSNEFYWIMSFRLDWRAYL